MEIANRTYRFAIDMDEVLVQYLAVYCDWFRSKFNKNYYVGDFHSYTFNKVHGGSHEETQKWVEEFNTSLRDGDLILIPGAIEGVRELQSLGEVHIVTARQEVLRPLTVNFLRYHFNMTEDRLHMCPFGAPPAKQITKEVVCKRIGADLLVDDSPSNINGCTREGVNGILFGKYGWNSASWEHEDTWNDQAPISKGRFAKCADWAEVISRVRELITREKRS